MTSSQASTAPAFSLLASRSPSTVWTTARVLLLVGFCPLTGASQSITVDDVRWGFDGTVQAETFVPLHILVRNSGPTTFTGSFQLNKLDSLGGRQGATSLLATALAPSQQNWIRFHVFLESGDVVEGNELGNWTWQVGWRGLVTGSPAPVVGSYRLEVAPRKGNRATVLLLPRGDVTAGGSFGISLFTDEQFPPSVTSTDSLGAVFLDHVPRWQPQQRQAFEDWLFRGGQVNLLKNANGQFPRFPSTLGFLNPPDESAADSAAPRSGGISYGAGEIRYHDVDRSSLDADFVKRATAPSRQPAKDAKADQQNQPIGYGQTFGSHSLGVFNRFKQMTTPDHNWLVIFGLAGVYWLLIFPGGLILGLKRIDYRIVLGAIAGTILVFSLAFGWVGGRAYDEATVGNSVVTARHLGGNRWDVQRWAALFVINGDRYTISHAPAESSTPPAPTQGQLFAVPGSQAQVPGTIVNGSGGHFEVEIAPYTLRPFLHRAALEGPTWSPEVVDWQIGKKASRITIRIPADPTLPRIRSAWVQSGDMVFVLRPDIAKDGSTLLSQGEMHGYASQLVQAQHWNADRAVSGGFLLGGPRRIPADKHYEAMLPGLLSRTLRWIGGDTPHPTTDDRPRLFLATDLPDAFQLQQPRVTGQAGRALFVQDLSELPAETTTQTPHPSVSPSSLATSSATTPQGQNDE